MKTRTMQTVACVVLCGLACLSFAAGNLTGGAFLLMAATMFYAA